MLGSNHKSTTDATALLGVAADISQIQFIDAGEPHHRQVKSEEPDSLRRANLVLCRARPQWNNYEKANQANQLEIRLFD